MQISLRGTRLLSQLTIDANLVMGTHNITTLGTVDGRDVAADGATLDAHGAANHTDRTRILFADAGAGYSAAVLADEDTYAVLSFAAAGDTTWKVNFRLPPDLVSLDDIKLCFTNEIAANDMLFQVVIQGGTAGESDGLLFEISGNVTVGISANAEYLHEASLEGTGDLSVFDKNDIIGIQIVRKGDDERDTNTGIGYVIGVKLEYTADM